MFPRVTDVSHVNDYRLNIRFSDGTVAELDFSRRIVGRGGVFAPLANVEFFKQVTVDREAGTLVWPNGVDFCPDVLYAEATGRPIETMVTRLEVVEVNVDEAIAEAEAILPGERAAEGEKDPRWQAIISVAQFVETDPDPLWSFVERWGTHPDEDLRMTIATCLLEHLLEYHFDMIFPRIERLANSNPCFAEMVGWCGLFGESGLPENAARLHRLVPKLPW